MSLIKSLFGKVTPPFKQDQELITKVGYAMANKVAKDLSGMFNTEMIKGLELLGIQADRVKSECTITGTYEVSLK